MATSSASRVLTAAASLTHRRPLTSCSAGRLVPQPPGLLRWVRREGGFVHKNLKIADDTSLGLAILSTEPIPNGSDLIALPAHLPIRFDPSSEPGSALSQLARRVPKRRFLHADGLLNFKGPFLRLSWLGPSYQFLEVAINKLPLHHEGANSFAA